MNFTPKILLFALVMWCVSPSAYGQCSTPPPLNFQNPSFEGPVGAGITPTPWTECMLLPGGSPQTPDTQPGEWGVTLPPANGSSYVGLVHEPSAGWQEGAAEPLAIPLVAGTSYSFTLDLANSSSTGGGISPGCAECQIWGGFSACDTASLLWHSGNITPYDTWQLDTATFIPTQSYTWIMFRVNSLGCSAQPYILLDNLGEIVARSVTVTENVINNDHCSGDSTGKAVVHVVGNNPPFTYQWSTPLVTSDSILNDVPAGTYTLTVTDHNSCTAVTSITITQPAPLVLTPDVIQPTCGGASTGSAYMSYAGGTEPMTFIWSNGPTTQPDPNLFDGTYGITTTDAHGCTASSSITIAAPTSMVITATITNATCNQSNGGITASVTGGATPYSFAWNTVPAQNTASATGLAAASYIVTVTDNNHCTASASFAVSQPPTGMTAHLTVTNVLCFGQSTGAIATTASGGSPPYSYSWSNGASSVGINNIAAGVYSVSLSDNTGCGFVLDTTITQPAAALSATINETDVKCFGQATGIATATATGGTAGYTYNWNTVPVQTSSAINNVIAGNYLITVTDANQCTFTTSTTIHQPAAPLAVTETHVNVLCFGGNNGSATSAVTGGTTGYTYSWNTTPAQTTGNISTLIAGTYNLTVTDANQCTATVASVISQPASPVQVFDSLSSPLCFGQAAASALAVASGGTPGAGYTYSWNTTPVQNTQAISNIPAGNYTVVATDANSCTASASITVAPPPTALTVTTTPVEVLCFGSNTGSIAANASGSYGNYTYSWSTAPVQTTATATQLIAGNYSVTVTDMVGCTATAADVVTQPAAPLALTTSQTNILCFGDNSGAAAVVATGGTSGYNYLWSTNPPQTTAAVTSLLASRYNVKVTDANGCIDTTGVTILQPAAPLLATSIIDNVSCNGRNDGNIQINTTGGTVGPGYTYVWNPGSSTTASTGNVGAGNYSMTVTDANNCTFALLDMVVTEPTPIAIATAVTNVSCPGHGDGKINSTVSGSVPPYTYVWSNGESTATDSLLNGGSYNVTATDSKGCTVAATNLLVAELPGVVLSANVTNILCFPLQNGAINVTAGSSFMPLQYKWSNGVTTSDLANIDTGVYSITVTDAHHCTADTTVHVGNDSVYSIAVNPDTATIKLGESIGIELTPFGSTFGTITWTPSEGLSCSDCANPTSSPIQSITYYVATTDVHGCVADTKVAIIVIPTYNIFVPNAFTPNNDGNNDFFEVFGNKEAWKYFEVEVFDRWGEKMIESNDMNFKWDGEYKGRPAPMGVYVYAIHLVYLDNHTDKLFKGTVTLIR